MNLVLCIIEASARAVVPLEAVGHVLGRGNRKFCGQPHGWFMCMQYAQYSVGD